jgi:hypothetical protein
MRQVMTLISMLIISGVVSTKAFANDFAAVVGILTNSADRASSSTLASVSGKLGYQAGVLGFIDLTGPLSFRSGFLYTQRNYTVTVASLDTDYKLAYFDIPVTLMYKFADYGGVFGGFVLANNATKECSTSGCSTDGVKSSLIGYQFGASFKFAPQMGAQFYYEMLPGNIQDSSGLAYGLKDGKSVVANFMFTFE